MKISLIVQSSLVFAILVCWVSGEVSYAKPHTYKLEGAVLDISPWGVRSNNKIDGIHPRLLEKIAKLADIDFDYRLTPLSRVVVKLSEALIDFSILIKREDLGENIQGLGFTEDLSQYVLQAASKPPVRRVGILRGDASLFTDYLKTKFSGTKVEELTHFTSLFRMLQAGRLDAILYSGDTFERFLQREKVTKKSFSTPELIHTIKVEFLVPQNNPRFSKAEWSEIKTRIANAIESLNASGAMTSIHSKFKDGSN